MLKSKKIITLLLVAIMSVASVSSVFATSPSGLGHLDDERAAAVRESMAFAEEYNQIRQAIAVVSSVVVNGVEFDFDAFIINDNNYFRIRDLAYVLNGTEKLFDVGFNSGTNTVFMTSGQTYTVVGGEMLNVHRRYITTHSSVVLYTAHPSSWNFMLDGEEISFTAYTIGGSNYVKLRDIAAVLDFSVEWDGRVIIDTSRGYTAQ